MLAMNLSYNWCNKQVFLRLIKRKQIQSQEIAYYGNKNLYYQK